MANPQKEHGYTQIANEILEHVVMPGINGSEYRIIFFVLRKTYGYNKKGDYISLSQFQKGTLMSRCAVVDTIKELVQKKLLVKKGSVYAFNKDWEQWVVHKRVLGTQKGTTASTQKGTKSSTQKCTHKRKKDNITKDREQSSQEVEKIIDSFKEVNPSFSKLFANISQRKATERMLKTHGYEKMGKMIALLPRSNLMDYMPVITTPCQLEDKMGQLAAGWQKYKNKTPIIL